MQLRLTMTNQEQNIIPYTSGTVSKPLTSSELKLCSLQEITIKAELLWTLKCIASNFSTVSCIDINNFFKAIFDSAVIENFSLNRTKVQYLQIDYLDLHLYNINKGDARKVFYVICLNEITNSEDVKE